jgi:hypothetical protein
MSNNLYTNVSQYQIVSNKIMAMQVKLEVPIT